MISGSLRTGPWTQCKTSPTARGESSCSIPANRRFRLLQKGDLASELVADRDDELRSLARHLVGPAEIAELLRIEANTINVWKTRHLDFPAPVRRLKSGDVWDAREVLAWAKKTGRYPPPDLS